MTLTQALSIVEDTNQTAKAGMKDNRFYNKQLGTKHAQTIVYMDKKTIEALAVVIAAANKTATA